MNNREGGSGWVLKTDVRRILREEQDRMRELGEEQITKGGAEVIKMNEGISVWMERTGGGTDWEDKTEEQGG